MSLCESCHAGCCRVFSVPVSGADIITIEKELGLSFWEFVCRWADPDGQIAAKYAPHFHFRDEPQTPFVIALLHELSHRFVETTKCRFLMECLEDDNDHALALARCSIYAHRPMACRAFPTRLDATGELAEIYDVPAYGRSRTESAYTLCPRQWEVDDVDPLTAVRDLVVAQYEMDFFRKVADVWNRQPQAWSAFPEFLRFVYERRVIRRELESERTLSVLGDARNFAANGPLSKAA